ncbi:DUF4350 domain-containing protein [Alteraurantiacibacter palmitatis]|uniref:DUF4350 domain-containing protein n=1 Tax=Alteraurantiacibacter palmitatis TaxID=2054628 RepID=A0ABV7EB72_9SPHN
MTRRANPFSAKAVLGLLLVGGGAFLLFLYAIGAGWTGERMAVTAHGRSNALDGYSGLVQLLERRGHDVRLTRAPSDADAVEDLLILTPGTTTDPQRLEDVLWARSTTGPTIVILPKWQSRPLPDNAPEGTRDEWVELAPGYTALWFSQVPSLAALTLATGESAGWQGLGLSGRFPSELVQAITELPNDELFPLITDAEGDLLAGYWNRGGWHPALAEAAGVAFSQEAEDGQDGDLFPLIVVAEPDLFNNYGMADEVRARAAVALVELAMEGEDVDIVFDLTMPGLGASENLLTLAFRPPFLAATLCLLLAMLVVGWRAFRRFGPPLAQAPAMRAGKAQLARNSAALIERARRWRLLGAPYAALVAARLAGALNIREQDSLAREAAIDAALHARGLEGAGFAAAAAALRTARRPAEILRGAQTLRSIERMLEK